MPTITPGVTPIQFSDWDSLYSALNSIVGPIPVDSGGNFIASSAGNGYGLDTTTVLKSSPYPFEKTITTISRTNPAQVTTSLPHRFETGDIVYINGLPGAWSTSPLEGQYFQIQSTGATTFQLLNTFIVELGLPAYPSSTSGKVTQPIVHQSQFNRIKTDVDDVWEHLFNNRTSGATPPAGRNTLVQGNVYNSYYNAISTISSKKLILGKALDSARYNVVKTATWGNDNTGLDVEVEVRFPSLSAFYQFFNTGGLIVFDLAVSNLSTTGAQVSKDLDWQNLIDTQFPFYYGGFSKSVLGYNSTTFPPGRTTPLPANTLDKGAYDATTSGYQTIFEKFGGGINSAYTSNYITIEHQRLATDLRALTFRVRLQDSVVNAFTSGVTADVTFTVNILSSVDPVPLSFDPNNVLSGIQVSTYNANTL